MNVKVEIELTQAPTEHEAQQMYAAAEFLTDDDESIVITPSAKQPPAIVAEFTIPKARQIDVVDHIGRAFWQVDHYNDSTIWFPKHPARRRARASRRQQKNLTYTPKQGQYLAFIYDYAKIHRMAPAEADFQRYFRVTPPTVHRMIVQLEERGFITRTPRQPRSIELVLSREQIPDLT